MKKLCSLIILSLFVVILGGCTYAARDMLASGVLGFWGALTDQTGYKEEDIATSRPFKEEKKSSADWEIEDSHPIFSEENWIFDASQDYYSVDSDGTEVVYATSLTYRSPKYPEYSFLEWESFGDVTTRVYQLDNEQVKLHKASFKLKKDGTWHGDGIVLWPQVNKDASGKITGITIQMVRAENDKFTVIMTLEVKRK